jgi:anti-anti-sigma regulatory factor
MQITVTRADGVSVVSVDGDLRIGSVADAKPELVAMLAGGDEFQLDLAGLGECDTAGLQLLLMTCASVRAKGKRIVTIRHASSFRAALDRAGIPVGYFEFQAAAFDDHQDDHDRR